MGRLKTKRLPVDEPPERAWQTCIHEAGHAVTCVLEGGRCDWVTIAPVGTDLATLPRGFCGGHVSSDEGQAVFVLAGFVAELMLNGKCSHPAHGLGDDGRGGGDGPMLEKIAVRVGGANPAARKAFVARCVDRAFDLLKANWHFVVQIAQLLLRDSDVPGKEVHRLIESYQPPKPCC